MGQVWPCVGRLRPSIDRCFVHIVSGVGRVWPTSAKFTRIRAHSGQNRPRLAKVGQGTRQQILAQSWSDFGLRWPTVARVSEFDQVRPALIKCRQVSTIGQLRAKIRPKSAEFDQTDSLGLGRVWPEPVRIGTLWAASLLPGHLSTTFGQLRGSLWIAIWSSPGSLG